MEIKKEIDIKPTPFVEWAKNYNITEDMNYIAIKSRIDHQYMQILARYKGNNYIARHYRQAKAREIRKYRQLCSKTAYIQHYINEIFASGKLRKHYTRQLLLRPSEYRLVKLLRMPYKQRKHAIQQQEIKSRKFQTNNTQQAETQKISSYNPLPPHNNIHTVQLTY